MIREYSLAYLTAFGMTPPDMIEMAARLDYDYVGLRAIPVTTDEQQHPVASNRELLRRTKRHLAATGIGVLDVELFRLTADCNIGSFAPTLDACAELGAQHILAQTPDANIARATEHFASLCDAAGERGLCVNLEFVTWTETPDLHAAATIVGAAGRDNAAVLVDTLHFSRSNCSPVHLETLPRRWLRYAQVCDAPHERPLSDDDLIFAARNERLFLGEGGLDVRAVLGALPEYIPYSIEIPRTSLARQIGIEEVARRALATTRRFVEDPQATSLERRGRRSNHCHERH